MQQDLYAIWQDGAWHEIRPGRGIVVDDVATAYEVVLSWTPQMRTSRGIKRIVVDPLPQGLRPIGSELIDDGGTPRKVWTIPALTQAKLAEHAYAVRDRRFAAGFDYDFGDERGIHRIGTTPDDMKGWDEVTKGSSAAIALGQGGATFAIITDTGAAVITALEWQQILLAATAVRQPIWQASFYIKAQIDAGLLASFAEIDDAYAQALA